MATKQFVPVAQVLGISGAGIMTGLITSFSIISVPVVVKTAPDNLIAKQWRDFYKIGASVMPPFAVTCSICFGFLASQSTRLPGLFPDLSFDPTTPFALYTAAAVAIPSIVPYTIGIMKPTNDRLMQKAEKTDAVGSEEAQQLIQKWIGMNSNRAIFAGVGTVLGAIATVLS